MPLCPGCGNYSGEVGDTCPMCGATIGTIDYRNTCPRCGQEVRWPGDSGYGGDQTPLWKIGLYIVLIIIILRIIAGLAGY